MAERGRPQTIIWCMRTTCLVTVVTDTYSEYVIVIAFPLQQWLQERNSVLLYTCILSFLLNFFHTTVTVQVSCFQLEQFGIAESHSEYPSIEYWPAVPLSCNV
jgi:hypothetical protein